MTPDVLIEADAAQDAFEIWQYLAGRYGSRDADRLIAKLHDACELIAASPERGHYRDDVLTQTYRCFLVIDHLVVYRWRVRPIEVAAIVHARRDLTAFFRRRRLPP